MEVNVKKTPVLLQKERVAAFKNRLPSNWKQIVIRHFPEYNTLEGGMLMTNIYRGLSASDVRLIDIMEKIADKELQ